MHQLMKIFHFVKPYRTKAALAMATLIVTIATDLAVPRLIQNVVDNGISKNNMQVVLGTMSIMLAVSALGVLMMVLNTRYAVDVAVGVAVRVGVWVRVTEAKGV